jgi:hypothetical protein
VVSTAFELRGADLFMQEKNIFERKQNFLKKPATRVLRLKNP